MLKFNTDRASAVSLTVLLMQPQISVTTISCSTLKEMRKKDSKENGITMHQRKSREYNVSLDLVFPPAFLQIADRNLGTLQQVHQSVVPVFIRESEGRPKTSILGCHWFKPRQELNSLLHKN